MKTKQKNFLCVFSKFIWWKIHRQGNRKDVLLLLYNWNNFFLFFFIFLFVFFYTVPVVIIFHNKFALHYLNIYAKSIYNKEVRNATTVATFFFFLCEIHFLLGHFYFKSKESLMRLNKTRANILLRKIFIKNYK